MYPRRYNFTGIGRSADGGKTFTILSGAAHGPPDVCKGGSPGGIYALPTDAKQAWATVGGKLNHSADGGETWSVVFDRPGLQWIAADTNAPHRFYVSGDRNVYATDDGATFTPSAGRTQTTAACWWTRADGCWPKALTLKGSRTYAASPDDVKFAAVAQAPAPQVPNPANGDMTAGTTLPDRWDGKWVGRGTIKAGRDATTFHSVPASLVSSTEGTDAEGNVFQMVDAGEGVTFTLSGFVKTQGVAARVAVQDFGGGYNAFGWQQAYYQNPDTDWTPFSKEITLPPGTGHVALVLWVKGKGKAWLDDVKVTGVKLPQGQP